ncbi:splicing factor 45 [Cimex lectularius]|uniref:Splicing factor 45 n=1 Tax=Cimex lectularius TaxID=79782 RepID=A0A8I6S1I9_CIMLE|nr:splicing factor 45 [Cimex lectularius]
MSLYDDLDTLRQKSDEVAGWSSGIKLFQSHLQLKKATNSTKRDNLKKTTSVLAPVFDLNSKKDEDEEETKENYLRTNYSEELDWDFTGEEYDPLWPNDYEKVVKDLREMREREKEKQDEERMKKREDKMKSRESRFEPVEDKPEEEEEKPRNLGAAIAPPPSLVEHVIPKTSGASVAAKIMAKYGFKEGQGLGKKEQGIAMALQVEKTSKRGGRIVHEKDMMPPPPVVPSLSPPPKPPSPPPAQSTPQISSITEIMKTPSKVVLLRNMVGPGEVDDDLEPEVKDECNQKYGDVIRVIIYERPDVVAEQAVRIFVEFKRIESAIKAVVDLNGRFFGGRQVQAGFYPHEKLDALQLLD